MRARALAITCAAILTVAVAACQRYDTPQTRRAQAFFPCPSSAESVTRKDTLDTRMLVPEPESVATELARRFDCRLRVTVRDGRVIHGDSPAARVIDVEIRRGRVARVLAVGEPDQR